MGLANKMSQFEALVSTSCKVVVHGQAEKLLTFRMNGMDEVTVFVNLVSWSNRMDSNAG